MHLIDCMAGVKGSQFHAASSQYLAMIALASTHKSEMTYTALSKQHSHAVHSA